MTEPTLSVVIPTYNRAQWLRVAISSALQQTHPPLEILVVDDGSTDNTKEVCAQLGSPVRHIPQEHAGAAVARNRGVAEARGDYIAFLDSDDLWEPTKLEIHIAVHRAVPQAEWSVSDCLMIDLEGRALPQPQGFTRAYPVFRDLDVTPERFFARTMTPIRVDAAGGSRSVYTGDAFELLFEGNFATPQCTVLHRNLLERVGGFDPGMRVASDTEYFHRVAAVSPVAMILEPLVKWRAGLGDQLTASRNMVPLVRNALISVDRAVALRRPLTSRVEQAHRRGRHRLLLRLAYAHLSDLERAAARDTVVAAWRAGAKPSPWSLAIFAASLLPPDALRGLHALKKAWRRLTAAASPAG
jgi:glycosyltransferase involved in cell wall biosynthesis